MKVPIPMVPGGAAGSGIAAILLLGIVVFVASKAIKPGAQPSASTFSYP